MEGSWAASEPGPVWITILAERDEATAGAHGVADCLPARGLVRRQKGGTPPVLADHRPRRPVIVDHIVDGQPNGKHGGTASPTSR